MSVSVANLIDSVSLSSIGHTREHLRLRCWPFRRVRLDRGVGHQRIERRSDRGRQVTERLPVDLETREGGRIALIGGLHYVLIGGVEQLIPLGSDLVQTLGSGFHEVHMHSPARRLLPTVTELPILRSDRTKRL